jgi:hypothetical protein
MSIAADKREYAAGRVAVIELLKEFIRALGKDPEMLARVLRKAAPLRPNRDSAR